MCAMKTMKYLQMAQQRRILFVVVFLIVALLAVQPVAMARQAGTTVKVFHLKHISAMEASRAVQPILSDLGSLTLQPRRSRITVQDRPEIVEKVAKVLADIDHLPEHFLLHAELLEGKDASLPAKLRAKVDPRLKRMFPFEAYQMIGSTRFDGVMGELFEADLGEGYHIGFVASELGVSDESPWHIPDPGSRLVLQSLVLERAVTGADGKPLMLELVRTRVVLSENQEAFIGAAGSEDSESGVVLILKSLSKEER